MTGSRKPNKHRGPKKMNSFRASKYNYALARLREQRRQLETRRVELEHREKNTGVWEKSQEQEHMKCRFCTQNHHQSYERLPETFAPDLKGSTAKTTGVASEWFDYNDCVVVDRDVEQETTPDTISPPSNSIGVASVGGLKNIDGEPQRSAAITSDESAPNGSSPEPGRGWLRGVF